MECDLVYRMPIYSTAARLVGYVKYHWVTRRDGTAADCGQVYLVVRSLVEELQVQRACTYGSRSLHMKLTRRYCVDGVKG